VVLVRGQGADLEVFWVRRSDAVPFQPGFMAFPGGKVDAADLEFDVPGVTDDFERAARVCAVREALEETGVLVAHDGAVSAASLAAAREALLEGRATLADVVREHGWKLTPESLTFAGRWQTPVFAPVRFDTLFFLSRLPFGQDGVDHPGGTRERRVGAPDGGPRPLPARTAHVRRTHPVDAHRDRGGRGGSRGTHRAGPVACHTPVRRVELQWGVVLHAMPTKPLPPAQHTERVPDRRDRDGARGSRAAASPKHCVTCSRSPTTSRARDGG
jgi:8-oxo-dGTP pyrophosphatase MutT (NUDIX family)